MELHLQRTYHKTGTNGLLSLDGILLCFTIELPWKDNRRGLSCIPEGRYALEIRWSPHHNNHLLVEHVPGRDLILLHSANNALTELQGCIAPVMNLIGPGIGTGSKAAFRTVKWLVYDAIHAGKRVWLTIYSSTKNENEKTKTGSGNNKTTGGGLAHGERTFQLPDAQVL